MLFIIIVFAELKEFLNMNVHTKDFIVQIKMVWIVLFHLIWRNSLFYRDISLKVTN